MEASVTMFASAPPVRAVDRPGQTFCTAWGIAHVSSLILALMEKWVIPLIWTP